MPTVQKSFPKSWNNGFFLCAFTLWIGALVGIDQYFFKSNDRFNIRFLYSSSQNNAMWNLPPLTAAEMATLDPILDQPFTYFLRGTHAYVFLSADQKYVLKFYRHPSHTHKKSAATKEYNLRRYAYFMNNYKTSFLDLKDETGLLLVHINHDDTQARHVTLIDKTGMRYFVPLNEMTFVLQHKTDLIFPTLYRLVQEGKMEEAQQAIASVIDLITHTSAKGYIHNDRALKRNYGLLAERAIYIDVGELIQDEDAASHTEQMVSDLYSQITQHFPKLSFAR